MPELFAKYPNLYGDLSANSAGQAIMRDPEFGLEFLEMYADRLFFATDMVNKEMVFPLGAWLDEQVAEGSLSRDAYEKICFRNAERMFFQCGWQDVIKEMTKQHRLVGRCC